MSARKASDSAFYSEEQVNEIWTPEFSNNVESVLKDTINTKTKTSQVKDDSYWSSRSGQTEAESASKIKDHIWHIQNYIPGTTEEQLNLWKNVNIPSLGGVIKNVTHSNSSQELRDKYKEGVLVMDIATNPGTSKEKLVKKVIPLGKPDSFQELYGLVSATKKFDKTSVEALEKVDPYSPTEYESGYVKPEAEGADVFKDSMLSFLSDPLTSFLDATKMDARGYSSDLKTLISQAKKDRKSPIQAVEDYLEGKLTSSGKTIEKVEYSDGNYKVSYTDETTQDIRSSDETSLRELIGYSSLDSKEKVVPSKKSTAAQIAAQALKKTGK